MINSYVSLALLCASLLTNQTLANTIIDNDNVVEDLEKPFQRTNFRKLNSLTDTWNIAATVGPQIYFGDHNSNADLGNRITFHTNLSVGYWINDNVGVRANLQGFQVKGGTQNGSYSTGEIINTKDKVYAQKFHYLATHAEFMFNLTPYITEKRFVNYRIVPYAGIGAAFNTKSPKRTSPSGSIGILGQYILSEGVNLLADIRGVLVSDKFDGEVGGRKGEGPLSITLGASINLLKKR